MTTRVRGVRPKPKTALMVKRAVTGKGTKRTRACWAYAISIMPPQPRSRLRPVSTVLDQAHSIAQQGSRTWAGRLIGGAKMTRILIVSDSLVRNRVVNKQLEAALHRLKIGFSFSAPVALLGTAATLSP
jgi:hypothetical protein